MTRRLFVSDVHLQPMPAADSVSATEAAANSAESLRLAAFSGLLRREAQTADEIYILGDLCEMWIGDDDDSKLVTALETLVRELTTSTELFFLPGNRDFLLGPQFAARTGLTLLPDPTCLEDGTLLAHGDALCTDDQPYQQMRALLRSADWQADILNKSLIERRAFGTALRERSKAENSNKASNIMDVNPEAVAALLTACPSPQVLIHGHTHRPGIHNPTPSTTARATVERVVLGAWERCGWWAIQETDAGPSVTLHCAAIQQLAALN